MTKQISLFFFSLYLWKNFSWGLTYFDEFIYVALHMQQSFDLCIFKVLTYFTKEINFALKYSFCLHNIKNEPPHGKTINLHRRKQGRRSASQ